VLSTRHHRRRPAAAALTAIFVMTFASALPVAADSTPQTLPFAQDWHDTTLIATNDDWSGVPGVVGFLGQDITTGTGVDPQTLLTDSVAASDQDVIANLPFTDFTNAGVAEFQIDDPVVALQPNGSADAPHIRISLETTGLRNITVAYNLRDLDATADNAIQPVALQFRIGSSGSWTNVAAAFVADATTGPNLAELVTQVGVVLPSTANDRSMLQVRIITANAVPADEWVGIDEISVTGSAMDQPPAVQSIVPGDGATDVAVDANFSVTFDEPVDVSGGWFDITCGTSSSHGAAVTGGPVTFTVDPDPDFANDESCTFTVYRQNVTDQDTDDPADIPLADYVASFRTVAVPKPPTVDAGGPYAVVVGESVVVSATGSQPDGQSLTYSWDLDHNGTFETSGQSVTFSAAGLPAPSTRTIGVRATAPTGLTATDEATVNIAAIDDDFAFDGFRGLKNLPNINESNLGTQFIRFSLGGDHGVDIFKNDHPMSASYPCGTTPPSVADQPARLQGESGFRYDAGADEYTFKWNIDKSWKNTCRVFVLGLIDGSTHNLAFRFGSAPDLSSSQKVR
jgi:hypothetical protein